MAHRKNDTGIVRQEKKSNALDNAGKRKFDVDNEGIELAAAFILWVHDATRNRLIATMSRHGVQCNCVSPSSVISMVPCARLNIIANAATIAPAL
jgi:hypothetical protein